MSEMTAAEARTIALAGEWVAVVSTSGEYVIEPAEIGDYDGDVTVSVVRESARPAAGFMPISHRGEDVAIEWGPDEFEDTTEALIAHIRAEAMADGLNRAAREAGQ